MSLSSLGRQIAQHRRVRKLTQAALARKAGLSRATLDALENGRAGELGFTKISKLLAALGLELTVQERSAARPTLEQLLEEDRNDQSLDRRR